MRETVHCNVMSSSNAADSGEQKSVSGDVDVGIPLLLRSFVSAQNLGHEEGIALFMSLLSKKGTHLESGVGLNPFSPLKSRTLSFTRKNFAPKIKPYGNACTILTGMA